jgi:serine/threonine protein kinase
MLISAGTRLGPYEIASVPGVWARSIAAATRASIAPSPSRFSRRICRAVRRPQRFDREAKAISSLSHPHICPLYDVGHQDGVDFLVMEYLQGETLAQRLKNGPLPPEEVFQYAIQITDALDTAHRHGVIHRDLKPGNIMLTKTGAKLLDFGLAKVRAAEAMAGVTALPTETAPLTAEGTILGTLQYMAPEQLEDKEADARTDIFALGTVIYEMATGRKAFEGKSQASLISAIMSVEPPAISTLQSMPPPALDHVVHSRTESASGSPSLVPSDTNTRVQVFSDGRCPRCHARSRINIADFGCSMLSIVKRCRQFASTTALIAQTA